MADLDDRLEPGVSGTSFPYDLEIQLSIAISLKRIADNMDKLAHPPMMVGSGIDYEELLKSNGYIVNKP